MKRILVIRGGALGDFILTLPAIKRLREAFPTARLELLGNVRFLALAENRFYADAIRSLDAAAFAPFFAREAQLPADLVEWFASFDLIVSYLFDEERIFSGNVQRCSNALFLTGSPKLSGSEHAALQLAKPLEQLGLTATHTAAQLFPNDGDRESVRSLLGGDAKNWIALHPGSGSARKNWPIGNWIELGEQLLQEGRALLVLGGEADEAQIAQLRAVWQNRAVRFVIDWPLPPLAALLSGRIFVGHDSGISHLAAAAGARCFLLFGHTDPRVWAPANAGVRVLAMAEVKPAELAYELMRIGIKT